MPHTPHYGPLVSFRQRLHLFTTPDYFPDVASSWRNPEGLLEHR